MKSQVKGRIARNQAQPARKITKSQEKVMKSQVKGRVARNQAQAARKIKKSQENLLKSQTNEPARKKVRQNDTFCKIRKKI